MRGKRNADGRRGPAGADLGECGVIIAPAIADAIAAPVKSGHRREDKVGLNAARAGRGLGNAHRALDQRLPLLPGAKRERLAHGARAGQSDDDLVVGERLRHQQRVGLGAHGPENGDGARKRPPRQSHALNRQPFSESLARGRVDLRPKRKCAAAQAVFGKRI